MVVYEDIEKILYVLYRNQNSLKELKTIGYKYNGYSPYGPYEDDSILFNRIFTINGDGSIIVHNDGIIMPTTRIAVYIAGSSTDLTFRVNEEQLYTLALTIELFKEKLDPKICYAIDSLLMKDYDKDRFNNYRKCIRDLLD